MVYIAGDSHVCFFSGKDEIIPVFPSFVETEEFKIYRLGAPLAYSLIKDRTLHEAKEKIYSLRNEFIRKIIFVFGEIDCRYHVMKQMRKRGSNKEVIVTEIVDRYIEGIKFHKHRFDHIGIWGVVPSTLLSENSSSESNPICGTNLERNEISKLFNRYVMLKCLNENFSYMSIFDSLLLDNGSTNRDYYMDDIHLSQKAMVFAKPLLERFIDL